MDGRAYLRALVAREEGAGRPKGVPWRRGGAGTSGTEAEGIAPAVVEAARQAVRVAITHRDVARLRAKGVRPQGEPAS